MSSTARLSVHSFNIDNSQLISWNHTSLVKVETKLSFSLSFIHERFVNITALVDDSIRLVLNGSLFLFGQRLVVSNIQMSNLCGLFSTVLPNVRAQNFSAGCEDNMSSCMMGLELLSPV